MIGLTAVIQLVVITVHVGVGMMVMVSIAQVNVCTMGVILGDFSGGCGILFT